VKEKLLKIIRHYGLKHQLRKLNEEVFELIEAIGDYEEDYIRVDCDENFAQQMKNHIEEEFADVMVLLSQIKHYYELDSEKIRKIMKHKINRQLDRMKRGE
jgi:NTP pyrophosphatase (non-canonical NTP hydrolase)